MYFDTYGFVQRMLRRHSLSAREPCAAATKAQAREPMYKVRVSLHVKRLLSKNAESGVIPYLKDKHSCVTRFFFRFGERALYYSVGLLQSAARSCICSRYNYCMGSSTRKSLTKDPFVLLQAVLMPSCARYIFRVR